MRSDKDFVLQWWEWLMLPPPPPSAVNSVGVHRVVLSGRLDCSWQRK